MRNRKSLELFLLMCFGVCFLLLVISLVVMDVVLRSEIHYYSLCCLAGFLCLFFVAYFILFC